MPQLFSNSEIYNEGKECSLCMGNGFIQNREGLSFVICRYCYGLGKRDRSIENKICSDINFNSSILTRDEFRKGSFLNCNLHGCCLREVKMFSFNSDSTIYTDTNFTSARLNSCRFKDSHFPSAIFIETEISLSNFEKCDFWHAKFITSKLYNVSFQSSAFQSINIRNSSLESVSFSESFLKNTNFEKNIFSNCTFTNCNFDNSHFLDNVFINSTFINCSFFSSNILTSNQSFDFKHQLLSQNKGLAICSIYSPVISERTATEEESRCINLSYDSIGNPTQLQYKVPKNKSFYCLWFTYGIIGESTSDNKKREVQEFWLNTLYQNQYNYEEIQYLVELKIKKMQEEYTQLNRLNELRLPEFSLFFALLVDELIGDY